MPTTGTALDAQHDVGVQLTWWRRPLVRFAVGLLVWVGLTLPLLMPLEKTWTLSLGPGAFPEITPANLDVYVALLLLPFLRLASYRKRDVLLIVLVPVYGAIVAAVVVSRLMALPRRDWTPRPDELPRVVRLPGARGAYLLRRTFGEAEQLRARWCRNRGHQHPYASWHEAQTFFCQQTDNH